MGCHFLIQGIFLTQGSNLGLPLCGQILYQLSYLALEMSVTQESFNTFADTTGHKPRQPWGLRRLPGSPGLSASGSTWETRPPAGGPGGCPMNCSQGKGGVCGSRGLEAETWVLQGPVESQEG